MWQLIKYINIIKLYYFNLFMLTHFDLEGKGGKGGEIKRHFFLNPDHDIL